MSQRARARNGDLGTGGDEALGARLPPAHIARMSDHAHSTGPGEGHPALVFDRRVLRQRRERAARAGRLEDFMLARIAEELSDRLATINRDFPIAACLGAGDHSLARALMATGKIASMVHGDRSETVARHGPGPALVHDDEVLPFADASLDALLSIQSLHWVNDLPGALAQMRRALRADGLFLGAMLGEDTLTELRQAMLTAESEVAGGVSPRVSPFVELRETGSLLQRAGFALPVVDTDRLTVRYSDPLTLMRELQAMAATNALAARSRKLLPRAVLMRAMEIYQELFSDPDGRIRATFQIVYLIGWAPHESQQKPLRPGSAAARLADALNATEHTVPGTRGRGSG